MNHPTLIVCCLIFVSNAWAEESTDKPAQTVEWLQGADEAVKPYSVTRVCFPEGRWMVVLMPIPLDSPYFQLSAEQMLAAPNVTRTKKLTPIQFDCLVDLAAGLTPKEAGGRRNKTPGTISGERNILAHEVFSVGSPRRIMPSIVGTPLGHLALLYAQQVELKDYWDDPKPGKNKGRRSTD